MDEGYRALSVWNPWAWALVTRVPAHGGRPLKTVENRGQVKEARRPGQIKRTGKIWRSQLNTWTLIHTGLHKPSVDDVEGVESLAKSLFVEMPDWPRVAMNATGPNGKRMGAIVGAVKFVGCVVPSEVASGYDRVWVNEDAGYCWLVGECVAFDRHIPCPGFHGFFKPHREAYALAAADLRSLTS